MTIGHEAAAAHLGVTKTKDAIFKTFYWPKCFRDVEDLDMRQMSKGGYPDAIPVANLCSTTVVNALLQIFSRMRFKRELQTGGSDETKLKTVSLTTKEIVGVSTFSI
ncbi:retrovirus-related Pol polyprotein from transposon 412 [Trichonephila clavipes]|uniref:Retrovirus-related Pol polyprotein from transposon 412 n=1 Tax=Trichonephila clavipes TaxID=2585209 RepID=A0A8X6SRA6_TRICX|nr:retrovirus-related Pol polyprotein from transposon 412 [Trichonephila clavipes]